jgi:hypothetical protein
VPTNDKALALWVGADPELDFRLRVFEVPTPFGQEVKDDRLKRVSLIEGGLQLSGWRFGIETPPSSYHAPDARAERARTVNNTVIVQLDGWCV